MALEIEVKFLGVERDRFFHRLDELNIPYRPSHQRDFVIIFDDRHFLRLRSVDGKNVVTYKVIIDQERYSRARELEVEVSDYDTTKQIFSELFKGNLHWEITKHRWIFEINGVKGEYVEVGEKVRYVELEGSEEAIERVIELLGLKEAVRSTETLKSLLEKAGFRPTPL